MMEFGCTSDRETFGVLRHRSFTGLPATTQLPERDPYEYREILRDGAKLAAYVTQGCISYDVPCLPFV
ncbi:uncharacterized protein PHALS_04633 [Plasmopara halstedii]|uniref:Uncharacterized protein n=1 Tax=Plasmopara halstedii TaxID=4781 RepID=A0A0N7L3Y7_PLAHL|nr:uncharacterized protein PHALS_04633 [Plasmopara halstedii]CEG37187.1 hypothetical protein PHALS_04633 [Plasmopara halstedii]|eukprot:XP_024573556.1 hypothetical protein PHALS_04633 [Plasmopara halstedii]